MLFLILISTFNALSLHPNVKNANENSLKISSLIILTDFDYNETYYGDKKQLLQDIFFDYLIENAMNRNKLMPEVSERKIVFKEVIIPNQPSQNITSEIENYGMEIVREFKKRKYFDSITYELKDNDVLIFHISDDQV